MGSDLICGRGRRLQSDTSAYRATITNAVGPFFNGCMLHLSQALISDEKPVCMCIDLLCLKN